MKKETIILMFATASVSFYYSVDNYKNDRKTWALLHAISTGVILGFAVAVAVER